MLVLAFLARLPFPLDFSNSQLPLYLSCLDSHTSYSPDTTLEDAVHTTILTLKESYEGVMSSTSLEIGIATMEEIEIVDVSAKDGKRKETRGKFRKLEGAEVKDYLANIA